MLCNIITDSKLHTNKYNSIQDNNIIISDYDYIINYISDSILSAPGTS